MDIFSPHKLLFSTPELYGVELPDTVHFTSCDLIFLVFAVYYGVACLDTMYETVAIFLILDPRHLRYSAEKRMG